MQDAEVTEPGVCVCGGVTACVRACSVCACRVYVCECVRACVCARGYVRACKCVRACVCVCVNRQADDMQAGQKGSQMLANQNVCLSRPITATDRLHSHIRFTSSWELLYF